MAAQDKKSKRRKGKTREPARLSLRPVPFEEAVEALLKTPPPPKEESSEDDGSEEAD